MVVGVKFLRPGMANQTVSGAEKDSMTSNCNHIGYLDGLYMLSPIVYA